MVIYKIAEKEKLSKIKQTELSDNVYNDLQKLKPVILKIAELQGNSIFGKYKEKTLAKENAEKIIHYLENIKNINAFVEWCCSCGIDKDKENYSVENWEISFYSQSKNSLYYQLEVRHYTIYPGDPDADEYNYWSCINFYNDEIVEIIDDAPIEMFINSFFKRLENKYILNEYIVCDLDYYE